MDFSTLDTLFNFILLAFWLRLWTTDERALYFNPNIASVHRATDPVLNAVARAARGLPAWGQTLAVIMLLIVFRGVAFPPNVTWFMAIGFEMQECPQGIPYHIAFSFLSFAIFLFKVWGISLLYAHAISHSSDHAASTLAYASRPFSQAPVQLRPLILLLVGIALGFLLDATGDLTSSFTRELRPLNTSFLLKLGTSAIAGWVSILPAISTIMIVLIIGSWVGMFANSEALAFFCRQWLDLFLGFLRNRPLLLGPVDLTPMLVFFAIQWIHPFLVRILLWSYVQM